MKSFLNGKKALDITPLHRGTTPALPRAVAKTASHCAGHAPTATHASVEVVKEGDKVVRIVVTCVCGERVEIECLYPAGS